MQKFDIQKKTISIHIKYMYNCYNEVVLMPRVNLLILKGYSLFYLVRHFTSSSAAWFDVPITQSVKYSTILFLQNGREKQNSKQFVLKSHIYLFK